MDDSGPLHISNRSGAIRVEAEPGVELEVTGGRVERDDEGVLHVRGDSSSNCLVVRCAPSTDLVIGSTSGTVEVHGPVGEVSVATVSGKVNIDRAERVDVRTKSGNVKIGSCAGDCHVVVVSANVNVGEAARAFLAAVSGHVTVEQLDEAHVKTVSGSVDLGARPGGRVKVKSVSGRVEVSVPHDAAPDTKLSSLSGSIECECPKGHDGEIKVATVSGTIEIACR
jgi:DUF4097 and DUF4098 domain-containing protein YvlB